MNKEELKKRIYEKFSSTNIADRFEAIQLLTQLNSDESLRVIEDIHKLKGNLGMKLEALRILPQMITPNNYSYVSRIIQIYLEDYDSEIVRNGLLAIQNLSPDFVPSEPLIDTVINLLQSEDTDIQYQAILSLSRLRSQFSDKKFRFYVEPLTNHPNKYIKKKATEALNTMNLTECKEEKQ